MQLFSEYVQPLTNWLHHNPEWAIGITFLISFSESLAIIGSIVPGTVTMTAIGILAGSGVMRIDLTMLAAILGAIAGDSASYFLGYYYRESLVNFWPFSKYPHWLTIGKTYFRKHGGKSVLLGRFIGPLRAIIPVIAGMMHMKQLRFFVANVISAIGWSIVYITPGILIGAASTELSAENASRLFTFVILLLAGIWLLGLVLKKMVIQINRLLSQNLHEFWLWSKKHPLISAFFLSLTPEHEEDHYPTAAIVILILFILILLILSISFTAYGFWLSKVNTSTYYFLQSFRVDEVDFLMLFFTRFISIPLLFIALSMPILFFVYKREYRAALYTAAVSFTTLITAKLLSLFIFSKADGILVQLPVRSFPIAFLSLLTALFTFISFYIKKQKNLMGHISITILLSILFLTGFSLIYLGEYWLSDVLTSILLGLFFAFIFWILYRQNIFKTKLSPFSLFVFFFIIFLTATIDFYINYSNLVEHHKSHEKQIIKPFNDWWNQKEMILPLFRMNRVGNKISLLNVQYLGSIHQIKHTLTNKGWLIHNETFFNNLLQHLSSQSKQIHLPLLTQLYKNKIPALTMTSFEKKCNCYYVFRLWPSQYQIKSDSLNRLWIGSLHQANKSKLFRKKKTISQFDPLSMLRLQLKSFNLKRIEIPQNNYKQSGINGNRYILLIKENT